MVKNPILYEINTRVWIKKFGSSAKLSDLPIKYFKELANKGVNLVWLMGAWETCTSIIEKCCFSEELITSYNKSLPDWKKEDVIGSPYSIDEYIFNPKLGNFDDLKSLKNSLNKLNIKLILDFVPNHFGADSKIIKSNPEIFLKADSEFYNDDPFTFFKNDDSENYFAHGRDPFFPAWTDTIQINYFSDVARNFMTNELIKLGEICDGVRCDMAMLCLNNVFHNTWMGVIDKFNYKKPENEFWSDAIKKVKEKHPDFIFFAEAYWDLEWQLQQLGFDYTYDKRLYDRLLLNDVEGVKAHLTADDDFQKKSVRFIENHDELRAPAAFGREKSLAAAVIISTVKGMKFYYDGQFEGKNIKLPLQLGREPSEKISFFVRNFYYKLLHITKDEVFREGEWVLLEPISAGGNNFSFENIFAWQWKLRNERRIIITNYSGSTSECRLKLEVNNNTDEILLNDLLNEVQYSRSTKEIIPGLFIELKAFQSHIFAFKI
jgi:glycosidase